MKSRLGVRADKFGEQKNEGIKKFQSLFSFHQILSCAIGWYLSTPTIKHHLLPKAEKVNTRRRGQHARLSQLTLLQCYNYDILNTPIYGQKFENIFIRVSQ